MFLGGDTRSEFAQLPEGRENIQFSLEDLFWPYQANVRPNNHQRLDIGSDILVYPTGSEATNLVGR